MADHPNDVAEKSLSPGTPSQNCPGCGDGCKAEIAAVEKKTNDIVNEKDDVQRNQDITAAYKQAYEQDKSNSWIGLAGVVSAQVGCRMTSGMGSWTSAGIGALGDGNKAIFHSIYPYAAYRAQHGYDRMKKCYAETGKKIPDKVQKAFDQLSRGEGRKAADTLGNFEQKDVAPPIYAQHPIIFGAANKLANASIPVSSQCGAANPVPFLESRRSLQLLWAAHGSVRAGAQVKRGLFTSVLILGFVSILEAIMLVKTEAPDRSLRRITIALGERVGDFIKANGIPIKTDPREAGFYVDVDKVKDIGPVTIVGFIALTFADGSHGFSLPVGRSLFISQNAGVIRDFAMTLFDEPKPFDVARLFLKDLIRDLEGKGWHTRGSVDIPRTPGELDTSTTWTIIAQLEDRHGHLAEITMSDYGLAPKQESWITVPLGRSDVPSRSYLVQVSVSLPDDPSYGVAIYPRRLFVNGSETAALPLRAWIDDPDWSPAAHGMVAVPDAMRHGDDSFWRMPQ